MQRQDLLWHVKYGILYKIENCGYILKRVQYTLYTNLFTAILSTGFFGGSTSSASIFSGSPHGDDARGDDACGDDARGDDARGDDARGDDALEEGFAEKFGLVPAFFASVSITFPL